MMSLSANYVYINSEKKLKKPEDVYYAEELDFETVLRPYREGYEQQTTEVQPKGWTSDPDPTRDFAHSVSVLYSEFLKVF